MTMRLSDYRSAHRRHPVGARAKRSRGVWIAWIQSRQTETPTVHPTRSRAIDPQGHRAIVDPERSFRRRSGTKCASCRTRTTTIRCYRFVVIIYEPVDVLVHILILPILDLITPSTPLKQTGSPAFIRLSNRDTVDVAPPNRNTQERHERGSRSSSKLVTVPRRFAQTRNC